MKKSLTSLLKTASLAGAMAIAPLTSLAINPAPARAGVLEDLRKCVYASYDAPSPWPRRYCQDKIKQQYGIENLSSHLHREHNILYNLTPPGPYGNERESTIAARIVDKKSEDNVPIWFIDSRGGIESYEFRKKGIYFVNKLGKDKEDSEIVIDVRAAEDLSKEIVKNWERKYLRHGNDFGRRSIYESLKDAAKKGKTDLYKTAYQLFLDSWVAHESDHVRRNFDHSTAKGESFAFLCNVEKFKEIFSEMYFKANKSGKGNAHTQASRIVLGGFLASKDVKALNDILDLTDDQYHQHIKGIRELLEKDFDHYSAMFTRYWDRTQRKGD